MTSRFCVDSSALIAVLNGEPEEGDFLVLLQTGKAVVGWPTVLEVRLWLLRRVTPQANWLDEWLSLPQTEAVDWTGAYERRAASAFLAFGKGRHPATLNFGDCMAYAVAAVEDVPLLFKGADFGKTDITIHPASVIL